MTEEEFRMKISAVKTALEIHFNDAGEDISFVLIVAREIGDAAQFVMEKNVSNRGADLHISAAQRILKESTQ